MTATTAQQPRKVKCAAKTLEGQPCKNFAGSNGKYCWIHNISRREKDAEWWNHPGYQALCFALVIVGIFATIYYGKGGATKEQADEVSKNVKEQKTEISELLALAKRTFQQEGPNFAKEFPLGYQIFAFGKDEFLPFSTGKSDVLLRVPVEDRGYRLWMSSDIIRLSLPAMDLVYTNGQSGSGFTFSDIAMVLPRKVGAECIINFTSTSHVTFAGTAFIAGGKVAKQNAEQFPQGIALSSSSGEFTLTPAADLSFVSKLVQTPTNGVVLVFGLRPLKP